MLCLWAVGGPGRGAWDLGAEATSELLLDFENDYSVQARSSAQLMLIFPHDGLTVAQLLHQKHSQWELIM